MVSHDDHDNGHEFVHQRERAVLQLACQYPFGVHVGNFFNFLDGEKVIHKAFSKPVIFFLTISVGSSTL